MKEFFQTTKRPFTKNIHFHNNFVPLSLMMIFALFFSCSTIPQKEPGKQNIQSQKEPITISRNLTTPGQLTAIQLTGFFLSQNGPQTNTLEILNFAADYISEARTENINSDVAFAQMCLETGFLKFGGLVQPEWHNYCGLGAMDKDHPGEQFATRGLGIRAHIQHLQAYATTEETPLLNPLIDPRYNWVHKTKYTPDIYGLTGTWATDPQYSKKLDDILTRMEDFVNK